MGILRRLREWREDSTGTLIGPNIDTESVDAGSLNTEESDITNETLIVASSDSSVSINSGTYTTPSYTSVTKDERGEWDGTAGEFTPDKDGFYHVVSSIEFSVGADGDRSQFRLRNKTDGGNANPHDDGAPVRVLSSSVSGDGVLVSAIFELTAGKAYSPQFQNVDSSDTLQDDGALSIRRWFR